MPESKKAPSIAQVLPAAAIPGGEIQIRGSELSGNGLPRVRLGDIAAPVVIGSNEMIVARVPDGAVPGPLVVEADSRRSSPWMCQIGVQVADSLHPVANPAVDSNGNVYTTFSGSRGQKTPVSVYRIDAGFQVKPLISDLMNATALAFDRDGILYVSSRYDGIVYQVTARGEMSVYVEGMGVATGLAFDKEENLYVGDRSGTIFKISRSRQIYVFATVEPSIAAYHLAFGPNDDLYLSGPTTSSFDSIYRISPAGDVQVFYRGLGRPQGMAFDSSDNLYVSASLGGRRGVVRITPDRNAELFLSGPNIVGLCFAPPGYAYVTTTSALYRVETGVRGRPFPNLA